MCTYFDSTTPAVFATSVAIMDAALIKVNIPWKYLSCFSAACFIIGSKWIEDECSPSIVVLAELHYKQWKEVDLRRMEEKILQVLGWEMPRSTYLNFLPHMMQVLARCIPHLPPTTQVIRNAELLLLREFSFVLKPAALALGALEHTICQRGASSQTLSFAIVALQDSVKVLDSELHEIAEALTAEDKLRQADIKSNKAYFPKKFETPYDSFCPDYRLYNIIEENGESESEQGPGHTSAARRQPSPNVSISDYDYSEDENDESANETSAVDKCDRSAGIAAEEDSITRQPVGKQTGVVAGLDQGLQHAAVCAQLSGLSSAQLQDNAEHSTEQFSTTAVGSPQPGVSEHSTVKHSASSLPVAAPISDGYFSDEESSLSDNDSGCEQDSDEREQDSSEAQGTSEHDFCSKRDSSEHDFCSEQDSSEQDSECDQDSDFHDSSPCRACHVKLPLDQVQGQALTFN
ncbi:uncharacterized protein LOC143283713 isoform X2 [Babylonia areolata]